MVGVVLLRPLNQKVLKILGSFSTFFSTCSSTGAMSEREERRFVEIPRESVRLMAESTGLELSDEVAALLAEDVCYRLREATQVRWPQFPSPLLLQFPSPLLLFFPVTSLHTDMFNTCIPSALCSEIFYSVPL